MRGTSISFGAGFQVEITGPVNELSDFFLQTNDLALHQCGHFNPSGT